MKQRSAARWPNRADGRNAHQRSETIRKMKEIFECGLKPEIIFKAVDLNFCDPEFADICADEMIKLLS